jgi:hypothetical protein
MERERHAPVVGEAADEAHVRLGGGEGLHKDRLEGVQELDVAPLRAGRGGTREKGGGCARQRGAQRRRT